MITIISVLGEATTPCLIFHLTKNGNYKTVVAYRTKANYCQTDPVNM